MAGPKVTIVGGGSAQWVPILIEDFANTPCLAEMSLCLEDVDAARLEPTGAYARHVCGVRGLGWTIETTTDEARALDGSSFVVVCISTGGLASMRADLEVARRHGVPMPIGDTVGPAGISRALRNVPVLVGIARRMERSCPDAWLLNVTNPLTALCRAVTRETAIRTVGLCHEVTNTTFFLSQLLDCGFFDVDVVVTGVNHLPIVTSVRVDGRDRMDDLLELARGHGDGDTALPVLDKVLADPPLGTGGRPRRVPHAAKGWTKRAVVEQQAVNYEILRRFGALPAADSDHTCEFFPWFVTERSDWGRRWALEMVTVDEREERELAYRAALRRRLETTDVPRHRSPEMVAPVVEGLLGGTPRTLPLNIPNAGQCPQLPLHSVVESMCIVDANGVRGRDRAEAPPVLNEWLRRVAMSQELTVDAALSGSRDGLLRALSTDPFASRLDADELVMLAHDIVESTRPWLAHFG